jgi:hypothetical protein
VVLITVAHTDTRVEVLRWFPDRLYAVLVPAYAGACLVAGVAAFLGYVMLKNGAKTAQKAKSKSA